ncbi:hypothetical protein L6270_04245 [Candidatus Parcubacteria bacterium]|nr:hypothetical protein [Patescibacteria group bacterium]MBU4309172.1 hypothetical protein [Patescibacteria group bacterium]MBU4432695.1 hypothetical protein [Patescibacteria group bacterium]MBU4577533.1 hypothetical protein [Patescibacteria group bacterium]MCG2697220.1 hypothetical protein [Candidatus Parcubacteria bacterium]
MNTKKRARQAKKIYSWHVLSQIVKDKDCIPGSSVVAICLAAATALITFAIIAEKANFNWVNF